MTPEDAWQLLQDSRKKIDDIDVKLVELLSRRAGVVEDVASAKRVLNKEVDDPGRREQVLAHARAQNTGPLSNAVASAAGGGATYFSPNGCAASIRSTRKTRTPLLCSQCATRYQPGPARIKRYGHTTRVLAAVASPRRYEMRSLRRLASASRTAGKCGLA